MAEEYKDMDLTGERFLPGFHGKGIEVEHFHRYLQACELAKDKVVLDIASGEGYGSSMLAGSARKVIGVDISTDAIKHASSRYKCANLEFVAGSCAAIPLADACVDVVISFETIEHHNQHEEMMHEIKRVLRPKGILLISSPDKNNYSVLPNYKNPFHVKELYEREFKELIEKFFANVSYFGQRSIFGSGIFSEAMDSPVISYWQEDNIIKHTRGIVNPLYWIAIASDSPLPSLSSCVLEQPIDESENVRSWAKSLTERDAELRLAKAEIVNLKMMKEIKLRVSKSKLQQVEDDLSMLMKSTSPGVKYGEIVKLTLSKIRPKNKENNEGTNDEGNVLTKYCAKLISECGLFDSNFYKFEYEDIRESGIDPVEHYLNHGWREHRDPSIEFSTSHYLKDNVDVADAEVNPLLHYIFFGVTEGRQVRRRTGEVMNYSR